MAWHTEFTLYAGCPVNDQHKPYFASGDASGFMAKYRTFTVPNCQYQRAENGFTAQLPRNYEDVGGTNYISFTNTDFGNLTYYARVRDKYYRNQGSTIFEFEIEPFLTYAGRYGVDACLVEREHPVNDWPGAPNSRFTQPEDGTLGTYVAENEIVRNFTGEQYVRLFIAPGLVTAVAGASSVTLGGVSTGMPCVTGTRDAFNDLMNSLGALPFDEIVTQLVMAIQAPAEVFQGQVELITLSNSNQSPLGVEIYNNKSFCYPYRYIEVSNNLGTTRIYKYESFANPQAPRFQLSFVDTLAPSVVLWPLDYEGKADAYEHAIIYDQFPQPAIVGDTFGSWFGNIIAGAATAFAMSPGATAAMVNTDTAYGALRGAMSGPENVVRSPGGGGGYANVKNGKQAFSIRQMCLNSEALRGVDNKFSAQGYSVNRIKRPNLDTRPIYNYVKTKNAVLRCPMSNPFQREMEETFNRGVTLWKNGDNFGDYSLDNRG